MKKIDPLGLLFPRKCVFCGRLLAEGETDFCSRCHPEPFEETGMYIPNVSRWTGVWRYEEPVRGALLRYKFQGQEQYGKVFGRALGEKIQEEFEGQYDILTYVPLSLRRNLKRGYNQVKILASEAGKELGIKPEAVLKKVRHNPAQSSLASGSQRKANVQGVYRAIHKEKIAGKRILLIDDIITTGSTVSECAGVLLAAGAEEVICAAVAAGRGKDR